jgi:hypothetical protein
LENKEKGGLSVFLATVDHLDCLDLEDQRDHQDQKATKAKLELLVCVDSKEIEAVWENQDYLELLGDTEFLEIKDL